MVRALRRGLHIQRYRQKNMTRDKEKKLHIQKRKREGKKWEREGKKGKIYVLRKKYDMRRGGGYRNMG